MHDNYLDILRSVLSLPTAPFREEAVVEHVRRFADARGLTFRRDKGGNVVLRYRKTAARGRRPLRWVFAAHMDHPGFIAARRRGRTLWARFLGSVEKRYFPGSRARFFAPDGEIAATVESARKSPDGIGLSVRLTLDRPANVPPGTVGMWDFPPLRVRGRRLSARACDDLAGVASVLCAMDAIARRGLAADVTGLLTRAEESGFVGALVACRNRTVPHTALLVAIETSAAHVEAPLGSGVVVRVGDRMRTFDPSLTAHVDAVAKDIARHHRGFRHTRHLMPGGTCESTVYAAWGYTAAAVCIPLGNYHNRGRRDRIAPEQIDLGDFASLVQLLTGLAESQTAPADTDAKLRLALTGRLLRYGPLLASRRPGRAKRRNDDIPF
jgi:putative aminopeptidase FrvX